MRTAAVPANPTFFIRLGFWGAGDDDAILMKLWLKLVNNIGNEVN